MPISLLHFHGPILQAQTKKENRFKIVLNIIWNFIFSNFLISENFLLTVTLFRTTNNLQQLKIRFLQKKKY